MRFSPFATSDLDAPIERIGAASTPAPYAPELERAWLPDRNDIADAIRRLAAV
jgi:2-oxoisovalerate dehydrogenase E1 component